MSDNLNIPIDIDATLNIPTSDMQQMSTEVLNINGEEQYQDALINQRTHLLAALAVTGLPLTQAARSTGIRFHEAKTISRTMEYKIEVLRLLSLAREEAAAGAIATKAGRLMELSSMAEDIRTIRDRRAEACDIRNMPDSINWWTSQGIPYEEVAHLEGLGENYDPTSPVNPTLIASAVRAPGADTGLLHRTFKSIGSGPFSRIIEEWEVDTSLNREIRDIHERVGRELGQWSDKKEVEITQKMYVGIAIADI